MKLKVQVGSVRTFKRITCERDIRPDKAIIMPEKMWASSSTSRLGNSFPSCCFSHCKTINKMQIAYENSVNYTLFMQNQVNMQFASHYLVDKIIFYVLRNFYR